MALSNSKIFLILCLSFIVGIFLGRWINYEIMAVSAMIFIIVGTIFYSNKTVLVFAIAGVVILAGSWRFIADYRQNDIKQFYGQQISGEGIIIQEPDERSDKTYLTIGNLSIDQKPLESKLLFSMGRFPEYEYGQRVSFEAKIAEPKEAENAGEFSYKNYLSRFGIDGVGYSPKILKVENGFGNPVKSVLFKFKQDSVHKLSLLLPEPQNSFLAGLLVGLKHGIPQDLADAFKATGTTHIIALSGFNITIIAQFIDFIFLYFFNKRISFILSLLCIGLFVIMAGASASVVRAGIMGILGLLALNIGRVNSITNALVLSGAVMLGISPQILHFDVGFQLSFLALLGMVYLQPVIQPYFSRWPKIIQKFLLPTIAAQIFVAPILIFNFGQLSLISPLVNLLILPLVPLTMLLGFMAGIAAWIFLPLGQALAWVAWLLLTYIIKVVELGAKIPFASAHFSFNIYALLLSYLILIFILWKLKLKNSSLI